MSSIPEKFTTALVVDEAASWLARMNSPSFSAQDRQAWEAWLNTSTEHLRVWRSAELLNKKFSTIAPTVGLPVLGRARRQVSRRTILRSIAALLAIPSAAWLGLQVSRSMSGTHFQTAKGERRDVLLPDGSQLALNTQSELEVAFDATLRLVRQLSGETHIQTAKDPSGANRPFIVETGNGRLRALGTRFVVRTEDGSTRLTVLEGAVEIITKHGARSVVVGSGQQARFTSTDIGPLAASSIGVDAWRHGVLYAQDMRLADFVKEISQYRSGLLNYDPAVADLLVSGTFHTADTDSILDLLADTLPVKIEQRTRYWITINPA